MFHKVMKFNLHKIVFLQNMHKKCSYCTKLKEEKNSFIFFKQFIGLSDREVENIHERFQSFKNASYSVLFNNYSQLMDFGFSKEDIIKKIQVLSIHPLTIKNYVYLLEEGGFNKNKINSKTLVRYKHFSKKSIQLLKNENYIQNDIDVQHNILSFTGFPKGMYPEKCDNSLSWNEIQRNMLNLYLGWKINMDEENITYAQEVYPRLTNKSFRLIERTLDILFTEFNFSKDKIRKNSYLIHSDPDNTIAILSNFDSICGIDVKSILKKHPKIILTPWKTIKEIQNHFEEFGIPESALRKAPDIYTLGSNSVYERLRKIKETPELASFINNPQIARLVFYQKKVDSRLKHLQNKNCVSLNLLVTSDSLFERFNCNGSDKGKSNDIMIYLTNVLNEDKVKLRSLLARHPYWHYISLLRIRNTYEFLIKKNVANNQICHCIQILLYPVNKIEDAFTATHNMQNISYLRNSSGSIKTDYILPLVLYNLEKTYHFSGSGIWDTNVQNEKMVETDSTKIIFNDTEELDHEPSTSVIV